ncbi:MAG TPA: YfiR family protein [Cellvibrionaceae bacterium]|nr:YfiR family protein [Cellvibrionaceae bacterium]
MSHTVAAGLVRRCLCAVAALFFIPHGAWANSDNVDAQLQVRAQFIYNFANFVEWPKDAFATVEAPIKVCLFGEVDFAPYLFAFADTLIGSRPLKIQRANEIAEIRAGCHILYVGQDERVKLPTFWQQIHYIYVLSIGDRQGFADKGGIINILRAQDKMQFEVNIENALANGLFLDSDLLALARVIKRNTAAGNNAKGTAQSASTDTTKGN